MDVTIQSQGPDGYPLVDLSTSSDERDIGGRRRLVIAIAEGGLNGLQKKRIQMIIQYINGGKVYTRFQKDEHWTRIGAPNFSSGGAEGFRYYVTG